MLSFKTKIVGKLYGIAAAVMAVAMCLFAACSPSHKDEVDRLNSASYAYHYRNLDSAKVLATKALGLADDYPAGYAEACNNLAFVAMAKMDYRQAKQWLAKVEGKSDNQIELLVADVQNMRLCQREARNKDFYTFRERATHRLRRIGEEADALPQRERMRAVYAKSEFDIVAATYFYYVGLEEPMHQALDNLNPDELEQDTAQYLNYLYNFGSGGAYVDGTVYEINQEEFDRLIECYMLASNSQHPYPYWQANALQAISEHLQNGEVSNFLIQNNLPAFQYLNTEQKPNELLAGNLAQRALNLFSSYGDVYQTAGAYRTLAECFWVINDYASAADCLNHALTDNKNISQAPDLVASIRERLSLVYSAVDDKPKSDYNRNIYLDLQESSRQDRQLEARATQLDKNAVQLNWMITAVVVVIIIVLVFLVVFDRMKRKNLKQKSIDDLLTPLREWRREKEQRINDLKEKHEEVLEQLDMTRLHIEENKKRNLEQRAKVQLVNSITPFIDRMINEVNRLQEGGESEAVRQERYQYISELTDKINQYNNVLTEWIQMRQGALNLRIESFPLQPLFDIVAKGKMSFQMKGITLDIQPTDAVVKADRILTLFMINTIADNARRFTPRGGTVSVSAKTVEAPAASPAVPGGYVEITIADTGAGMDEEALAHVFDRTYTGGHGFGLLNCKGIIEKYKKVSSLFGVCRIQAQSRVGEGSTFSFRLPRGIQPRRSHMAGVALMLVLALMPVAGWANNGSQPLHRHDAKEPGMSANLQMADAYADSAYFSNINGTYGRTLEFADSARHYLNLHYLSLHPGGKYLMLRHPWIGEAAELQWWHDSVPTNYDVILDLRNESAVAALALHKWALYESNNKVYTKLFHKRSADRTLDDYVRTMQSSENSKTVAVILLVLLLLQLPVAYYLLYYRHILNYRFAVVEKAREQSISHVESEEQGLEMAEDELHRAEYENDKLHVANSVLDNCLSTLKHETMYYPSRIRQLIDSDPSDVASLRELVDYYKALYTMLSAQAMEQVEGNVKYDRYLNHWLGELMKGNAKKWATGTLRLQPDSGYAVLYVEQQDVAYDERLHAQLFTPLTSDMRYLLCRQIVRELGEVTNLRGCGIQAKRGADGCLCIEAVVPARIVEESYANAKS